VNKVLIVGVDPTLRLFDSTRLGNVREMAQLWRAGSGMIRLRVSGAGLKDVEYEVADLWPDLSAPSVAPETFPVILKDLVTSRESFASQLGRLSDDAKAGRTVTTKSQEGFYHATPAVSAQQGQRGSLSFVKADAQAAGSEGVLSSGSEVRPPAPVQSSECAEQGHVRCCAGSMSRVKAAKANDQCDNRSRGQCTSDAYARNLQSYDHCDGLGKIYADCVKEYGCVATFTATGR